VLRLLTGVEKKCQTGPKNKGKANSSWTPSRKSECRYYMFTEDRKRANADRSCLHGRSYGTGGLYGRRFSEPTVMTDQCGTNSKLLVSRDSLAGRGEGARCHRLGKPPVVG